MSFYGDPYGFGSGYGPPSYYPAYPAQYYTSGNTVYHHRRKPPKEKDNVQVWCDICDVGCIGQQSYIEHCGGRKHQLLERKKAQQASASLQEGQRPTTDNDQPAPLTTSTTTPTPTSSSSTLRFSPYESTAHQGAKGSQGKFYCELCKIYSNDHSTFQLHLAGKKHKMSMQRQQSASSDPYGPSAHPISPMSVIHPPRYHIPSSPRPHFTPTLTNTPTNVEDDLLLNSKLESLTPSISDTQSLRHLVETVTAKLEEFSEKNPSSQQLQSPVIMETKLVGPYAWGTLLKVNLVADMAVITKEHPTFGTLRFMQQAISATIPEAQIEIGKDTMDMHIRMPQGAGVHLLFTWVQAWESGERAEESYMYPKPQDYTNSPSSSPPSSPSSPTDSSFPPYASLTTHEPPSTTPTTTGSWIVRPWSASATPWTPHSAPSGSPSPSSLIQQPLHPPPEPPHPTPTSTSTFPTTTTENTTRTISSPSPSPSLPHEDGLSFVTPSPSDTHINNNTNTPLPSTLPHDSSSAPLPSQAPPTPTTQDAGADTALPNALPAQDDARAAHASDAQDINMIASQRALLMIRQAMWFSQNSLSPNVRQCIKIMKDLRHRHTAFASVNNWALEVMVVNALRSLPLSASISQSLRAIFAFVASGTLLPGVDLLDPCVQSDSIVDSPRFDYGSVLQDLTQEERLAITKAAQKILNDIAFGRWEVIIG